MRSKFLPEWIMIDKNLATAIGLNEALVIGCIAEDTKYKDRSCVQDGFLWFYNTLDDLSRNFFPFWDKKTIRQIFSRLEKMGVLISTKHNKFQMKMYRINPDFEIEDKID